MLTFALDNPPPATVVLITGDRDFAYAVSILKLRGYTLVVIAPQVCAHASLKAQASLLLDWQKDVLGLPGCLSAKTSLMVNTSSTHIRLQSEEIRVADVSECQTSVSSAQLQVKQICQEPPFLALSTVQVQSGTTIAPVDNTGMEAISEGRIKEVLQSTYVLSSGLESTDITHTSIHPFQHPDPITKSAKIERSGGYAQSNISADLQSCVNSSRPCYSNGEVFAYRDKGLGLRVEVQSGITDRISSVSDLGQETEPMLVDWDAAADSTVSIVNTGSLPLSPSIPIDVDLNDEETDSVGFEGIPYASTSSFPQDESSSASTGASVSSMPLLEEPPCPVPFDSRFVLLVDLFRVRNAMLGQTTLRSSEVARELKRLDPLVYEKAGVIKLKDYLTKAKNARILISGELNVYGDSWVEMEPSLLYNDASWPTPSSLVLLEPLKALLGPGKAFQRILLSRLGQELKAQYPSLHVLIRSKGLKWHVDEAVKVGVICIGDVHLPGREWAELIAST